MPLKVSEECRDVFIRGDEGQIQECLLNLCNNAVHAMNERGDLTLSLVKEKLDEKDISAQYNAKPGKHLKVSVSDTGCGMDRTTREKAFDLFFTTKEVNKGTGMGLSTVQGIVQNHGGMIKLHSTPGKGSTFELYFPLSDIPEMKNASSDNSPDKANEGEESDSIIKGKRILFVDDDPNVAKIGAEMLQQLGCKATALTNSHEALMVYKANAERFDMLLTDQTMPEMSGLEFIEAIREINPHLPVALCTGFSSKIEGKSTAELGVDHFLYKPFEIDTLKHCLRECLE
jgi:CheY-like chemotaxis protein